MTANDLENGEAGTSTPPLQQQQSNPRALAEIRLNTLLAGDGATSSEDERSLRPEPSLEDARSLVGVSIGREQTRLKSPTTPAAEKAAALSRAGGYFDREFAEPESIAYEGSDADDERMGQSFGQGAGQYHPPTVEPATSDEDEQNAKSGPHLPSPWRVAASKRSERSDHRTSILRDGLFTRKRSSSGPGGTLEGLQKMFVNSLPSMPKHLSLPFSSSNSQSKDADGGTRSKRSSGLFPGSPRFLGNDSRSSSNQSSSVWRKSTRDTNEEEEENAVVPELPSAARPGLQPTRSRGSYLRRSTSEGSLITQRTLSRVSSLGDDSRFEHVNEQVNSRLKAIRDSWQDSNLRFANLKPDFLPDFLSSRNNSLSSRKGSDLTPRTSRVSSLNPSAQDRAPVDPMTRQPYHSTRSAAVDIAPDTSKHPNFNHALTQLEGDIVVLGGYRGSILRSAEPPHRQVWVPIKVGLNIRKVDLEVGLDAEDDARATDKIFPDGMLTHIGPVDISRRLFRRLRGSPNARSGKLRVHDYGYDWRLDPGYLSNQLCEFLQKLECNQPGTPKKDRGATVIAHSLGGLITRHAVNQRPDLFKGVVYAGVPNTCVNILGPLRNGDDVLLSSKVLTAQVNFSIRTSFALLPLDGRCFFDKDTREEYPVDFFDVNNWLEYRFSPCVARPLPSLTPQPKQTSLLGSVTSMASSLPIPGRKKSASLSVPSTTTNLSNGGNSGTNATARSRADTSNLHNPLKTTQLLGAAAEPDMGDPSSTSASSPPNTDPSTNTNNPPSTTVTLPYEACLAYLTRTLASVKAFKQALAVQPSHSAANAYPPAAVIYGKSIPTVYGARVAGREAIKHADAYDDLAFASGDGVVLARAAMLPEGYKAVRGGVVSSERGHVTLLGDLEAVGRCLSAIATARERSVGLGNKQ
ncbi:hypothetical protein K431DRAFT_280418 [Polychaeton citri CBS 116435]|uniref:Alpha/beta-hydrolase n=1 Tax=Polychaeton citri CBS 116435 TaxID=1314669 RepID=A0A9P4QII2_9PEZI|nr:hypothetical protein K431DRAFT_280418 [Polychaeton citri CBS 116435]